MWTHRNGVRSKLASSLRLLSSLFSRLEAKWEAIQVGRQGSYSIERLESLDYYCKTTSTLRAVFVCVLTPLPALAAALLLESLTLQPPSAGWAANWAFWVQVTVICFILTTNGMLVLRRLVVGLPLTFAKIMVISSGVAAGFTGFALVLARVVGFPVPFVVVIGGIPNVFVIGVMLILTLGISPFRSSSPFRPDLLKFHHFLVAHETLVAIYPLVKVLYGLVPVKYQSLTMLLLPLWKFAAKKYVARSIHEMEDYVPGIVAFNVDYFSTLFISVSMTARERFWYRCWPFFRTR